MSDTDKWLSFRMTENEENAELERLQKRAKNANVIIVEDRLN